MTKFLCIAVAVILSACLSLIPAVPSFAQTTSAQKGAAVTNHATGPFDVKVTPQDDKTGDTTLGRMMLDKQYHGDLEGTGKGQMLTAGTAVQGFGAYVAIERVTGNLKGRTGSFILQHCGTMMQGVPQMTITIVPDSGTGQLAGIAGKLTISIAADGQHSYNVEYTVPAVP